MAQNSKLGSCTAVFERREFGLAVRMVYGLAYLPRAAIKAAWRNLLELVNFPIAADSDFTRVWYFFTFKSSFMVESRLNSP